MGRNFCCTDLHGMWQLWEEIKFYCGPDDTIYFLGDAADRGVDGLRIIKDLLLDKRVVYLKGNHEDMFTIVAPEAMEGRSGDLMWWYMNGGQETYEAFMQLDYNEQMWFINRLNALPDHLIIKNAKGQTIFLSHAGTALDYEDWEKKLIKGGNPYIWDRKHIHRPWSELEEHKDWFMVHGHTPTPILLEELNNMRRFQGKPIIPFKSIEIVEYCDGHKFDLDLMSFATNKVALFDLDEMKVEKYFDFPIEDLTYV